MIKSRKNVEGNLNFALDPKTDKLRSKFHCQTEIVSQKVCATILPVLEITSRKMLTKPFDFNPILHELWNDVITRGGAIMARMDSSHPEAVSRYSRAKN